MKSIIMQAHASLIIYVKKNAHFPVAFPQHKWYHLSNAYLRMYCCKKGGIRYLNIKTGRQLKAFLKVECPKSCKSPLQGRL
jgi:hypothetical protein